MSKISRVFVHISLLISLLIYAGTAAAAEYYVAPNGNDSNDGSINNPWKTVERPKSTLKPGDTVNFRQGEYWLTRNVTLGPNGNEGAPITYRSYPGETATFVYDLRQKDKDPTRRFIVYMGASYLILDGINIRQTEDSRRTVIIDNHYIDEGNRSLNSVAGISVYGSHNIVRNCSIDNTTGPGLFYGGGELLVERCKITNTASHGFYISGANGIFKYNIVDGSRGYSNQQGFQMQYQSSRANKVYGNLFVNGQASGIVMSGRLSNNEVFNNVFVNPGSNSAGGDYGYAINAFCEDGTPGTGNKIYNNTFIGKMKAGLIAPGRCEPALRKCDFHSPHDAMSRAECDAELARNRDNVDAIDIYNNIFYPISGVRVGASKSNIHDNIFYNVTSGVPANNLLSDPKLANPSGTNAKDAMLLAGSPAIDTALNPAPPFDYLQGLRDTKPDKGAFEFGATPGSGGALEYTPVGVPTSSAPVLRGPNGEVCPVGI